MCSVFQCLLTGVHNCCSSGDSKEFKDSDDAERQCQDRIEPSLIRPREMYISAGGVTRRSPSHYLVSVRVSATPSPGAMHKRATTSFSSLVAENLLTHSPRI